MSSVVHELDMRMSIRPQELFRQLKPMLRLYPGLQLRPNGCSLEAPGGELDISWEQAEPMILGTMKFPVTVVRMAFSSGLSQDFLDKFVSDWRIICSRGGG